MVHYNLSPIGAQPLRLAFFGQGVGDIFVDDLACNGTERRLQECRFSSEHNCNHSEDAGVQCECEYAPHLP